MCFYNGYIGCGFCRCSQWKPVFYKVHDRIYSILHAYKISDCFLEQVPSTADQRDI